MALELCRRSFLVGLFSTAAAASLPAAATAIPIMPSAVPNKWRHIYEIVVNPGRPRDVCAAFPIGFEVKRVQSGITIYRGVLASNGQLSWRPFGGIFVPPGFPIQIDVDSPYEIPIDFEVFTSAEDEDGRVEFFHWSNGVMVPGHVVSPFIE